MKKWLNRILVFLSVFSFIIILTWIYNSQTKNRILEEYYSDIIVDIEEDLVLKEDLIVSYLAPTMNDVVYLKSKFSRHHFNDSVDVDINLERDLKEFMFANFQIDQVRILKLDGMEYFRLNQQLDNSIYKVPNDKLQNKSDRSYFKPVLKLKQNEIYISELDLNWENGAYEVPYKPVIRLGTPIIYQNGKTGFLIVNVKMDKFLRVFQKKNSRNKNQFFLVSDKMNLISAPIKYSCFDDFLNGNEGGFKKYFPDLKIDLKKLKSVEKTDSGLFAFRVVQPYQNAVYFGDKKEYVVTADSSWVLAALVPFSVLDETLQKIEKDFKHFMLISFMCALFIALLTTLFFQSKVNYVQQLKFINEELELKVEQRTLQLQEKVNCLTSSIRYALRVQKTLLPQKKIIKSYFEHSFIFYRPKDIVAGDFYWMDSLKNDENIIFAVGDCTGHGVPGAMVSLICINALNKAIKAEKLTSPAKILDRVSTIVDEAFLKDENGITDGMDVSLCYIDFDANKLIWAGANSPLWLIRERDGIKEFVELRGTRIPIGGTWKNKMIGYKEHVFDLQKGDLIYLFTDGFADQYSFDTNKKLMRQGFKELVLRISEIESMDEQYRILSEFFENWKGDSMQIDDVCVVGLRI